VSLGDDLDAQARSIIDSNLYMTLATADGAGTPWASPVYFAHRDYREFLWISKPEARHSRNLAERPEAAIVIFDSQVPIGTGQAVYVEATVMRPEGGEFDAAIKTYSRRSQEHGGEPLTRAEVEGDARLRLYRAEAIERFVLGPSDERIPVSP
jgi:nitroimidazol reductase NimA-like FMN-containing flavoprotein (pyridoxamine 5'-phosphate oxidase superfamily)